MQKIKFIGYLLISLIMAVACNSENADFEKIDFKEKDPTVIQNSDDSLKSFKVAIAAMISPKETFVNYQELVEYLARKLNRKIELVQRKTYQEVNDMIESKELDFAFICSGAYVDLSAKCSTDIIAVPETNGKSLYQAYIIANIKSNVHKFLDFEGKSFAFTDHLSNTGRLYALKKLKEMKKDENTFFSHTIFSNAHDNSIQLVNKGIIDGATVDGLIYHFLEINYPDKIKNIKVIEKSEYYGIPPIVSRLEDNTKFEEIRNLLFDMHKDTSGKVILRKLLIDKFVPGYDSSYNSIRVINQFVKK